MVTPPPMPPTPPEPSPLLAEPAAPPPRHLAAKAALLLLFSALLVAGATLFLLYARGVFEPTQSLVLTTDDSEGVVVGMDMTFSGFPIARVRRVELGAGGEVRILLDVARKDAHWLRTSSVFTLVRGLVGGASIRAYSGVMTDPPLADGAQRPVLRGDATADVPRLVAAARETLENLQAITATDAALQATLANLQAASERLKGPQGALGLVLGNDQDARRVADAVARTNALLVRADQLAARLEQVVGHADTQVFGAQGLVPELRGSVLALNGLLADARTSLGKLDAVLAQAQGIATDVRGATVDLAALRAEVDANLRRIDALIGDINRRWPFARDPQVKLP